MAVFKCKMCGGDLELFEGVSVAVCEYCGTKQTVPKTEDEKKTNLFNRANRLRFGNEFDRAAGIYESIIAEFPEEAEAFWGLVLCKYGIEYVDDPATANKIPTCHRTSFESVLTDPNYLQAIKLADSEAKAIYEKEAEEIDRLQQKILNIVNREKPFDVFICYKETDAEGNRTPDSVLAQDIYDHLTEKGFKVFFARITLEDKLGQEYEPYIFAALNSSKVMLAVGTSYENFNAVWVKNEWSRFLALCKTDTEKTLIPVYKDIDAYDLPEEFKNLQAQDMAKIGSISDVVRGVAKIVQPESVKNNDETVAKLKEQIAELTAERERNKKKSKRAKIMMIPISILIVIVMVAVAVFAPSIVSGINNYATYNNAIAYINQGNYARAYEDFVALGDYKDSAARAAAIYTQAQVQSASVGDSVKFGSYNGEDIEWLVLEKTGDKVLVISKNALEKRAYHDTDEGVTWENCTLRAWLNDDFLNSAIPESERDLISTVTVSADPNPKYSTDPGNDTEDKVFLLSIDEANEYFSSDEDRICYDQNDYSPWWWLRSPGEFQDSAAVVINVGNVREYGNYVHRSYGVRPALWINLNS